MPGEAQGRYRTSYEVRKRKEANGIKAYREIDLADENASKMVSYALIISLIIFRQKSSELNYTVKHGWNSING